ncbi:uncharacterized protein LOC111811532 isoform X2 [Cucurbita pepo subsp. pepo]|uniref:uncharacterized protein LOC111811532 isoform X2 n=1 Tax=Cucurbita pepo subsp. pepo TaxID=3664 RepID=UPI000C9D469A|nr:uncharacterized protein LOC111811532 isoform X2 [Cucurbita pepo subsp. pepo]
MQLHYHYPLKNESAIHLEVMVSYFAWYFLSSVSWNLESNGGALKPSFEDSNLHFDLNFIVIMWIFKCSCAEERKVAMRKVPEQAILAEVRRMVEEMQTLNKKLEETESAIEEYFKPIDKEAEALMKLQLEGEERTMKNMVKVMQQQALFEKAEAGR